MRREEQGTSSLGAAVYQLFWTVLSCRRLRLTRRSARAAHSDSIEYGARAEHVGMARKGIEPHALFG